MVLVLFAVIGCFVGYRLEMTRAGYVTMALTAVGFSAGQIILLLHGPESGGDDDASTGCGAGARAVHAARSIAAAGGSWPNECLTHSLHRRRQESASIGFAHIPEYESNQETTKLHDAPKNIPLPLARGISKCHWRCASTVVVDFRRRPLRRSLDSGVCAALWLN